MFLTGLLCSSVYAATDSELRDKNTQLQAQTQELTRQVIKATADNKAAIDQRFDAAINNLDISLTTLDGELANIEAGVTGVAAATTATSNITTQNLIKIAKESLAANGTTGLNYDMLSNSSGLTQTLIGNATPWTTGLFDIGNEDFSVADAPGLGGAPDGVDGLLDKILADHNLDFHLGEEIHDVFRATVQLGVALLPPEALGLGDGDALNPDFLKGFLHFVELEGLDNGLDLFHLTSPRQVLLVCLLYFHIARRARSSPRLVVTRADEGPETTVTLA